MLRCFVTSSAILVMVQTVAAQPAVYQDGILTIPEGAIVTADGSEYYTGIRLQDDGEGNFTVIDLHEEQLAYVDQVEVIQNEQVAGQFEVLISGHKSTPCVDLREPVVVHGDYRVDIVLAETGPFAEVCILRLDAYESTVSLATEDWSPGTWVVSVNGVQAEFLLD